MIGLTINGARKEVAAGLTLEQLLEQCNVKRQHVAIEVNTQLVPRETFGQTKLVDGDRVEIVTLVGGG